MAEQRRGEISLPPPSSSPRRITSTGLTGLLDLSPDALVVVDRTGTIVQANEQAAVLFGYRLQDLQEQRLEVLLPERLRALHAAHRGYYFTVACMRSMDSGLDLFGQRKDGTEFPVDISLRPVLLGEELLAIGAVRDMSEQRRTERERAEQAELLRQQAELIDLAHDAIFTRDLVGRVAFWNKGAEALYGYSVHEARGRISHSLLKTRFPESLSEIEAQVEQSGLWEGELVHTCRDGRVVTVESRWSSVRDASGRVTALMEMNRDNTGRRQLEQQAQTVHAETVARLALLQQIIDALPGSIYLVYGHDARLLLANRASASLWGAEWRLDQSMEEFLASNGISVTSVQGRLLALQELATLRVVRQGETVRHHQETIRRPNKSSLPVLVNAVVLDLPQGRHVLRQTTDAERLVQHAPTELVALVMHQDVSALREAEYLKDEFIGVAAHELRNPLAVLKGFASMLMYQTAQGKGAELSEWQQEAVGEIHEATERLDNLTEDLLDVTRLQAGRLALSRKPTDLVDLTRHLVAQWQMTTEWHVISLDTTLSSLVAEVDHGRIEQVLSNLLGNAIKYSPQGGPIELTIGEEGEPRQALLSIRDHGIGIPANQQARMFGRFVRAENARASEITGSGLGLYLSREFVERHGGRLWFESSEGVGSAFFLTLPLVSTNADSRRS
jgi:PAS domain S-box-containing protein